MYMRTSSSSVLLQRLKEATQSKVNNSCVLPAANADESELKLNCSEPPAETVAYEYMQYTVWNERT